MMRGSKWSTRMKLTLGTALLMLAATAVLNVVPSAAQEPPPPIAAEPLTARSVFVDDIDLKVKIKLDGQEMTVVNVDDPSRTVDVRYTVQPGARFPWHSHAGPVVVNIVSGALIHRRRHLQRAHVLGWTRICRPGPGSRPQRLQPRDRADGVRGDLLRRTR